jgi:hypothetical protein
MTCLKMPKLIIWSFPCNVIKSKVGDHHLILEIWGNPGLAWVGRFQEAQKGPYSILSSVSICCLQIQLSLGTTVTGMTVAQIQLLWIQLPWVQLSLGTTVMGTTVIGYNCHGYNCHWVQLSWVITTVGNKVAAPWAGVLWYEYVTPIVFPHTSHTLWLGLIIIH